MEQTINGEHQTEQSWQDLFFGCFMEELYQAGYTPEKISKFMWKPFTLQDINTSSSEGTHDFSHIGLSSKEVKEKLNKFADVTDEKDSLADYCRNQKTAIIVIPGFLHHVQKHPAFINVEELNRTAVEIKKLSLNEDETTEELLLKEGDGLKVAYINYPRSNADSDTVVDKIYNIISNSHSIKKWVEEENRQIVWVGYSYGAPLSLELMSSINTGERKDPNILNNITAFLAINGAIYGSCLADTLLNERKLFNVEKYKKLMSFFKPAGWPLGMTTKQHREDLVKGIRSLGREVRNERLSWYIDKVPSHITYFSLGSILPLMDYSQKPWRNFDGITLFAQALISNKFSIYNDGQMVYDDCLIPDFPHVEEQKKINLGAVRSNHWGVAYRTFNMGVNNYPRLPLYKALARTLKKAGE